MADHADDGDNNDVFVFMGGDQRVPQHVRYVRVHKSVKIIRLKAFGWCKNLVSIEIHDGVEIIVEYAFYCCTSLIEINLSGVRVIGKKAFAGCRALEDVEFGDKLETIAEYAFADTALKIAKLPKVRVIGNFAFKECYQLTHAELSEDLERIGEGVFYFCPLLRRIADNVLVGSAFTHCEDLSQVDLIGGVHETISLLLLESWRDEMNDNIDRINQLLPNTSGYDKMVVIHQWMERVMERIEHYKSEHYALLKNNMTQIELALWKSNIPNVDPAASRDDARVTCGANIIIPHVMSFLNDEEVFPTVRNVPL